MSQQGLNRENLPSFQELEIFHEPKSVKHTATNQHYDFSKDKINLNQQSYKNQYRANQLSKVRREKQTKNKQKIVIHHNTKIQQELAQPSSRENALEQFKRIINKLSIERYKNMELEQQNQILSKQINQIHCQIEELYHLKQSHLTKQKQRIQELLRQNKQIKEQLEQQRNINNTNIDKINQFQQKIRLLHKKITTLQQNLQDETDSNKKLQALIIDYNLQKQQFYLHKKQFKKQIIAFNKSQQILKQQLANLRTQINQQNTLIKNLEQKLSEKQIQVQSLTQLLKNQVLKNSSELQKFQKNENVPIYSKTQTMNYDSHKIQALSTHYSQYHNTNTKDKLSLKQRQTQAQQQIEPKFRKLIPLISVNQQIKAQLLKKKQELMNFQNQLNNRNLHPRKYSKSIEKIRSKTNQIIDNYIQFQSDRNSFYNCRNLIAQHTLKHQLPEYSIQQNGKFISFSKTEKLQCEGQHNNVKAINSIHNSIPSYYGLKNCNN